MPVNRLIAHTAEALFSLQQKVNCLSSLLLVFSLSGVRPSVWRGGASPGQTVAEAEGLLRPRRRHPLRPFCCFRLPAPAFSAVVSARPGHGRCCGRHRPSWTVEAEAEQWSQCHEASSQTGFFIITTTPQPHFKLLTRCYEMWQLTSCWMCSWKLWTLFTLLD